MAEKQVTRRVCDYSANFYPGDIMGVPDKTKRAIQRGLRDSAEGRTKPVGWVMAELYTPTRLASATLPGPGMYYQYRPELPVGRVYVFDDEVREKCPGVQFSLDSPISHTWGNCQREGGCWGRGWTATEDADVWGNACDVVHLSREAGYIVGYIVFHGVTGYVRTEDRLGMVKPAIILGLLLAVESLPEVEVRRKPLLLRTTTRRRRFCTRRLRVTRQASTL